MGSIFTAPFTGVTIGYNPRCGGTLVWPGVHRLLGRRYLADPVGCEWVEGLVRDGAVAELAKREGILPVETLPRRGDVLFHDFFCGRTRRGRCAILPCQLVTLQ